MTSLRTWKVRAVGTASAAVFVSAVNLPVQTGAIAGLTAAGLIACRVRSHRGDRFTRTYIRPAETALQRVLGDGVRVELHVDRDMGNLAPRLLRDASAMEMAVRRWYGARVEPVVQWPGVQAGRARDRLMAPLQPALDYVRRPRKTRGPSIRLTIHDPYLTPDQRSAVAGIIASKIPVADTLVQWDTVGEVYRATWTLRKRPPRGVSLADIATAVDQAAEDEFVLGLGTGATVVSFSLGLDSPHVCVSARSMSGKSTLVGLIAAQALRRGARVILLDPKGSHPALVGLPNVDYCITAEQCHNALIKAGADAENRNILAFQEGLTEWAGQRVMVVAEELNILTPKLRDFWAANRDKGDPALSPAISALRSLSFAGRSAKYHLIAIAQYLTAHTAAGPESRENYGVRLLARYSANQWRTLCAGTPMPSPASHVGRWYSVVDGDVTEVQVAYLRKHEIVKLATVLDSAEHGVNRSAGPVTLRQAVESGLIEGSFNSVKGRWHRSADRPSPVAKNGQADLYDQDDLKAWSAANLGSAS